MATKWTSKLGTTVNIPDGLSAEQIKKVKARADAGYGTDAQSMANSFATKTSGSKKSADSALTKQEQATSQKATELRTADEASAEQRAKKFYSEGTLGRMGTPDAVQRINPTTTVRDISNTNGGLNQSIAQTQQAYEESKVRDAAVADALSRMKDGLLGFNTPEIQAMREQGRREIQSQGKNTERSLLQYAGAAGLSGQSLASEMRRTKRAVQQDIATQEVDLIAANAQEQRARLGDYGNFANTAYSTQTAAKDAALGRLLGATSTAADYTLSADKSNQAADTTNASNQIDVAKVNAGIDETNINNKTGAEKYNLDQREKELAGEVGIAIGDPAVSAAYRDKIIQEQLAREQIAAAKKGV